VARRVIGERQHRDVACACCGRARDDGRSEAETDEPDNRLGRRELERDAANDARARERSVDLLPQPDSARISTNAVSATIAARSTTGPKAWLPPGTTTTSGSSASTRWARSPCT
jgi:hypothetical protein